MPEEPSSGLGGLFGSRPPSIRGLVEAVDRAAGDPAVKGLLLRVGSVDTGWARVQELRDALVRFRRSGKPSWAHLEFAGNQEYFLATGCAKVAASPTAMLDVSGLSAEVSFYRGALDKLGVEAQFEGVGKYKNAPNQFTEVGFTAPHREQMEALVGSLFEQYVRAIAEARGLSPQDVRALVDRGPFHAPEAKEAGLVDELLYRDQVEDRDSGRRTGEPVGLREGRARVRLRPAAEGGARARGGGDRAWREPGEPLRRQPRRLRHDRPRAAPGERGRRRPRDHPARGQPGRLRHGLRRHLARGGRRSTEEARRGLDGGLRGLGRLLHRDGRGRDRRGAGDDHRVDRCLLRQVQPPGPLREARRVAGDGAPREERDALLGLGAVDGRGAGQGPRPERGVLRDLRRQGGRGAEQDAAGDRRGGPGPGVDGGGGASGRSRGHARWARCRRGRRPCRGPASRRGRRSRWWSCPRERGSSRRSWSGRTRTFSLALWGPGPRRFSGGRRSSATRGRSRACPSTSRSAERARAGQLP